MIRGFPTTPLKLFFILFIPTKKNNRVTNLQYGEVFQYTVHHVFFRQLLELVNEVYHVFTHWRSVNSVNKPAVFIVTKLSLQEKIVIKDLKRHLLHKSQKVDHFFPYCIECNCVTASYNKTN